MRKINIGKFFFKAGFVFYIIQNCLFGWNEQPMSNLEAYADKIVIFLYAFGFVFYFKPLFKLYEEYVKYLDENGN